MTSDTMRSLYLNSTSNADSAETEIHEAITEMSSYDSVYSIDKTTAIILYTLIIIFGCIFTAKVIIWIISTICIGIYFSKNNKGDKQYE